MVVDDDKDTLAMTTKGLFKAGFEVHGFSDSIAAIQHLESGCKDCGVLVSDIKMPNMNGFQLIRRARELRPDLKVVLMTAFEISKSEFDSVFPSTRVENVMQKPFLPSALAQMIKEIYNQSQTKE